MTKDELIEEVNQALGDKAKNETADVVQATFDALSNAIREGRYPGFTEARPPRREGRHRKLFPSNEKALQKLFSTPSADSAPSDDEDDKLLVALNAALAGAASDEIVKTLRRAAPRLLDLVTAALYDMAGGERTATSYEAMEQEARRRLFGPLSSGNYSDPLAMMVFNLAAKELREQLEADELLDLALH